MTTTAIGSTAGVAGGSMGVSGGTSSSKCDCGCGSVPCVNCLIFQPTANISASAGPVCIDGQDNCAADAIVQCIGVQSQPIDSRCVWVWNSCCQSDGFSGASLNVFYNTLTNLYTVIVNNYNCSTLGFGAPGCVVYQGDAFTTTQIQCIGGVLTGTVVVLGVVTFDPTFDCTGSTATVTFGGSETSCAGDCWLPVESCIGTPPANTFITCADNFTIGPNVFSYETYPCLTLGVNPVSSLPMVATVLSLSDITIGSGDCSACVVPCYVQGRQCLCDSTSTGNDDGPLIDAWFLCSDIPSGGAFSVPVIGCCYIQQNNFIGPNPGFPDGSMTLGGTLYASSDVTPSPSCADCIGCPDLTTAPATLTVVLSGIPNGLTGGISKDDALPCGTSTDGTYTLTKFGGDYGYSDGAFFGIGITCGSDGMGGHIWTMQVFGLAPGCPPSESSNCSFFATLPVGASPCYPHGTFTFTSKSEGCGDALGGTGVVS